MGKAELLGVMQRYCWDGSGYQLKRKIEDDLAEVNGQLSSMKKRYADMEKRNTRLRNAFVQKYCEGQNW